MDWIGLKDELARMLLEKDALHIYAAVLIQLVVARWTGRTLGHLLPWNAVLAIELLNEIVDLARGGEPRLMPWQIVSGVHDIINTMALPTLLLILCRRAPLLLDWRGDLERRNGTPCATAHGGDGATAAAFTAPERPPGFS
jgi:hypothetical protein